MFEHKKIDTLDDFFVDLNNRKEKEVYFYRINGYSAQVAEFIQKYYKVALNSGVVLEGKIPNPNEKNLAYYHEMMGDVFCLSEAFIKTSLRRWMPRINNYQLDTISESVYRSLVGLREAGKNDNMIKNSFVKFMCWLYYKFERVVSQLGENKVPKILYEGEISKYELMLIYILSCAGCDVVLLQYNGDDAYLRIDPRSELSYNAEIANPAKFPDSFNLKWVRQEIERKIINERLYGVKPDVINCTNAWISGKPLDDIRKPPALRGSDEKLFYNCFSRVNGVEDKATYLSELFRFQMELKNSKRNLVILQNNIPHPTTDEVFSIKRKNYTRTDQMILDLSSQIKISSDVLLQRIVHKAFVDIILDESQREGMNINKLTNKAVYLLCWLNRYQAQLFAGWRMPNIACIIYLGGCSNENESLFLRMMARTPTDVLVLVPNLNTRGIMQDRLLYEVNNTESMAVEEFPSESTKLQVGTAAYHAERELDAVMYNDSGLFRNHQYQKAVTVTLKTMYEEISLLWDQELKYRPSFSTVDDVVNIPVIFAKVSGVKDGLASEYWAGIKSLITEDTFVISNVPFVESILNNPIKPFATEFFKNGELQKSAIKSHKCYQYGVLREETQNYILDKLQLLIDQKLIRGTFENGTEYTIVATVLNLQKDLVRLIQKFDFTKKNPKLIYINTTDTVISLEDAITAAFLNLAGFDVVFFVPTGYRSVEQHFSGNLMEEHQVGEYLYDLRVPNSISALSGKSSRVQKKRKWHEFLFGKGK